MKRKPHWVKQTLKMADDHNWKAPPGHNIFVADQGAVRFNYPHNWLVVPKSDCIEILDAEPPNDNCRLAVSYLRLPPIDWSGLPMTELIRTAIQGDERQILKRGSIVHVPRQDIEIAWIETYFMDPAEKRAAFSRLAIARGWNIQALITMDFWADDAARVLSVWDEVMRSVDLGRYVEDPTRGDLLH